MNEYGTLFEWHWQEKTEAPVEASNNWLSYNQAEILS
jgi:hypothetical protein